MKNETVDLLCVPISKNQRYALFIYALSRKHASLTTPSSSRCNKNKIFDGGGGVKVSGIIN